MNSTLLLLLATAGASAIHAQSVDKPLQVGGDVKAPVLIKQVDPKYPRHFFRKPDEGSVLVGLVVDEQGMPVHIHIKSSESNGLADAAKHAVAQYRFKPATKEDIPVAVEMNVAVDFRVK